MMVVKQHLEGNNYKHETGDYVSFVSGTAAGAKRAPSNLALRTAGGCRLVSSRAAAWAGAGYFYRGVAADMSSRAVRYTGDNCVFTTQVGCPLTMHSMGLFFTPSLTMKYQQSVGDQVRALLPHPPPCSA